MRGGAKGRARRRALIFARGAHCYWREIFPLVQRELTHWHRRAAAIPDPVLRRDALFTHRTKSRHAEGLAAFAVLSPPERRREIVRGAVAFETMLDYLDTVSERPAGDPLANGLQLHRAFEVAIDVEFPTSEDYYDLQTHRDDGGYLAGLIATCREVVGSLPSYRIALDSLRRCAVLTGQAQSLNHAIPFGLPEEMTASWARETAVAIRLDREMEWWEIIAAGSSSLPIGALMAAAADPGTSRDDVSLVEAAYFPWVAALTTLLDSMVDVGDEELVANHLNRYPSRQVASERLDAIATRSLQLVSELPSAELHELILGGAGGYYLAQAPVWQGGWDRTARGIYEALGEFARPALVVHCLRQGRPRAALRVAGGGTAV